MRNFSWQSQLISGFQRTVWACRINSSQNWKRWSATFNVHLIRSEEAVFSLFLFYVQLLNSAATFNLKSHLNKSWFKGGKDTSPSSLCAICGHVGDRVRWARINRWAQLQNPASQILPEVNNFRQPWWRGISQHLRNVLCLSFAALKEGTKILHIPP